MENYHPMNRAYNKNREGYRVCVKCKIEKPLTSEFYSKDKNRFAGFMYKCKSCEKLRRDLRVHRYIDMTPEQKAANRKNNRKYTSHGKGRAVAMINAYRKVDKNVGRTCDLDTDFMLNNIFNKPCSYCGSTDQIGCDRVDNRIGHIRTNVIPACKVCNMVRGNTFSYDEMIKIGLVIKEIRTHRTIIGVSPPRNGMTNPTKKLSINDLLSGKRPPEE